MSLEQLACTLDSLDRAGPSVPNYILQKCSDTLRSPWLCVRSGTEKRITLEQERGSMINSDISTNSGARGNEIDSTVFRATEYYCAVGFS